MIEESLEGISIPEPIERHTHIGRLYSANNKIVCADCQQKSDAYGNECFCVCHIQGRESCQKCSRLHMPAGIQ